MKLRHRRFFVRLLALLLAAVCLAGPALAAEKEKPSPAEAPVGMVFRWLNFFLVFGAAGYLIAKYAPAYFRGRASAISAAIDGAAAAKAEAERQLREAEEKVRRLDQEVAELRVAAQREGVAEAERIRGVAREETEKIARAAQREIKAAERAARIELKAMAARLAVKHADALIQKQLTGETQAALFRFFLEDLSRSVN